MMFQVFRGLTRALGRCLASTAAALIPLSAAAETAPMAPSPSADTDRIVEAFQHFVEDNLLNHAPGLALTVVQRQGPAYIHTYGVRRLGQPEVVDPHTTFRLASLSKGVAAAAAGIAVHDGTLDWDSKLNSFLPDIRLREPDYQDQISVRHILSNSTGLMPHTYTNLLEANVPYERILPKLGEVEFVCDPGACYTYQNVVYSFIGDILHQATGMDYPTLLEERLFTPLRMTDASVTLEDFVAGNHAEPHQRRRLELRPAKLEQGYYSVAPAAGVNASISDMTHWLQALLGKRPDVLPAPLLDELFTGHTPVKQRNYYRGPWKRVNQSWYGLGWRVFDYAGTQVAFHSGWVDGYHAEIVVIPSHGLGMALLMNSDHTNGVTAVPKFLDLSLGLEDIDGLLKLADAQEHTESSLNQ